MMLYKLRSLRSLQYIRVGPMWNWRVNALLDALSTEQEDFSKIGRIIDDCRVYKTEVQSIQVRHIYREVDGVTHRLVTLTSFSFLETCG